MSINKFYNLARMYSTTTGDSDIVLTTAVPGCITFENAGVFDSDQLHYGIITYNTTTRKPQDTEVGTGKYISSGLGFQRLSIAESTNDDLPIVLTGLSEVYLCPNALDYNYGFQPFSSYYNFETQVSSDSTSLQELIINTTWNDGGIASIDSDELGLTIAQGGFYDVRVTIGFDGGGAMNGTVLGRLEMGNLGAGHVTIDNTKGYVTAWGITGDMIILSGLNQFSNGEQIKIRFSNMSGVDLDVSVFELTVKKWLEI